MEAASSLERDKNMEEILKITELLGEDNTKRLRDGITELLLNTIEDDLHDMGTYLIEFEELFGEVRTEVFKDVKDKMVRKYTNEIENKFEELFKKLTSEK